jgi:hypothetical protein
MYDKTLRQANRWYGSQGTVPILVKPHEVVPVMPKQRRVTRYDDVTHHIEDILGSGILGNEILSKWEQISAGDHVFADFCVVCALEVWLEAHACCDHQHVWHWQYAVPGSHKVDRC